MTNAHKELERLRRKCKAFQYYLTFSLTEYQQNTSAMCQQLTTLEQYNNHLHREKQYLQMEVRDLKRRRGFDKVLSKEEEKEIEKLLESDEDDIGSLNFKVEVLYYYFSCLFKK